MATAYRLALGSTTYDVTIGTAQLIRAIKGDNGVAVELQKTATHIQWRYVGGAWVDLVALADIAGSDGKEVELQKSSTHIQWRLTDGTWADLVALADLKGDTGQGVPTGGTASQVLNKIDGTDHNTQWSSAESLDAKNTWEDATTDLGTISGTANCTIDASVAAEATVTFAASAVVTLVASNFTASRSSVLVRLTNGGAATSVAYGSIVVAGGSAPSWTAAGVDEFILYRDGSGVINLAVGRKDIKVIP